MELRIATYNIHKGVSVLVGQPRVHSLKQAIHVLDADILFLQEVQGRHDFNAARYAGSWPEQGQHAFLAGDSHHYAYGMNSVYDHGHHGNALLSRYPILSSRNQDVSDHAYEQRGILHCVVQTPSTVIHCYVVHLGLFGGSRRRQCQTLIEAVNVSASKGEPVIIAGDFNDWSDSLSADLRTSLKVTEAFDHHSPSMLREFMKQLGMSWPRVKPARTFPAGMPWLRLDRIYVRGFEVGKAEVMRGRMWARLSDHAPLVATLRL